MANVLLLAAPVHHTGDIVSMRTMPPPSIYVLAAILREAGHGVRVLDPSVLRKAQPLDDPAKGFPELIDKALDGITAVGISSNSTNWGVARFVASEIHRRRPELPLIFGGVHPSYFDRHILASTPASFVVRGEGELTLPALLLSLEGKIDVADIPGVTWRKGDEVIQNASAPWLRQAEIEAAPPPAYDLIPDGTYSVMPVETSRGCRFSCAFCSVPRRTHWQGLSPAWVSERILGTVQKHHNKFRDRTLYFVDDCFTADGDRAGELLDRLVAGGLDWSIIMEARATDLLQPGLLGRIPRHLLYRLAIGVECGYDLGWKRIGKGLTMETLNQALEALYRADLVEYGYFSFIIGFPWETEEDCLRTVHTAARLVSEYGATVNLNWLFLYPSSLWLKRHEYGISVDESVFDDPTYLWNHAYFQATHPSITPAAYQRIQETIQSYRSAGCALQAP